MGSEAGPRQPPREDEVVFLQGPLEDLGRGRALLGARQVEPPGHAKFVRARADQFGAAAFTQEQAECLADGYMEAGITDPNANVDVTQLMDVFTQCGVSMEDLGNLGAGA